MNMHRSFIAALFFIFIACDDGNGGDSTPQDDLNAGGNATEETADTAEEDLSHLEIILPGQPTEDTTEGADGDVEIPPPNPGEFGAPCSDNDECYSGWCVSSPLGPVCTRNCDSDCPDGWFCLGSTSGADVSFICVPRGDRVCEPCAVDNQCGSGFCMQMDEGKRCTEGCRGDGDCLDGYSCKELESELSPGNFLRQCVPDFNSCDCLPGNEGLERPCSQNNAEGSCWGVQTCLGEEGWSACDAPVPTKEVCNGMDDNCNFLADDVEGRGDACEISNTYGTCTGVLNCVSGAGEDLVCVAQTPSEEVCNGMDDNCDGQIDEPFMDQETGRYTHVNACGNCFTDCEATFNIRPNAYGICDTLPETPTCVMACDTHYFDLNAVPGDGCEFYLDPEAIYVGVDSTDARDTGECGIGPAETGEGRYPCASITHGLARAKALNRKRLIIADGLYTEQVVVEAGIDLLGGHHTLNWERHVEATNTIVRGPSSTTLHAITLAAEGITVPTLIEGLVLYGPTSFAESKNAYAVWIRNSDNNLQLRDNLIFGGDAGDGASGNAGQDGNDGAHGQVGERAMSTTVWRTTECQADSNTPGNIAPCRNSAGNWTSDACGLAGSTMCGSVDVSGGAGAGAVCPVDTDIQPGGTNGKGSSATGTPGTGGIGGMDKFTPGSSGNCGTYYNGGKTPNGAHGQDGGRGQDRRGGNGCTEASGSIQSGHWVPAAAPVGLAGQHGGGGGGGGAGGGKDVTNGTCYNGTTRVDELGGSGGGGGAGGCGGAPGNGGQGGGASIAVMIYNLTPPSASALPVLSGNVISLGTGGKGGQGGSAGKGGRGGNGGNGGKALDSIMGEGGRGGQGGDGGHGGGGGGGCGGPAFGIYVHGYSGTPNYTPANTFVESGNGGPGGRGGASPGQPGQDGNDGFVKNTNYAP